jgi:hypothetical protein
MGWMAAWRQAWSKAMAPYKALVSVKARWLSPSAFARVASSDGEAVPPNKV